MNAIVEFTPTQESLFPEQYITWGVTWSMARTFVLRCLDEPWADTVARPSMAISRTQLAYPHLALSQLWKNFANESVNTWNVIETAREARLSFCSYDLPKVIPELKRMQWFRAMVSCADR